MLRVNDHDCSDTVALLFPYAKFVRNLMRRFHLKMANEYFITSELSVHKTAIEIGTEWIRVP